LTGPLERTNEPYAIAKIAGLKMCESFNAQYGTNFISVMPTNLYGPQDNFDLETSHVLPALVRKMYLGRLLSEGDWDGVRRDILQRPFGGLTATSSKADLIAALQNHGLQYDLEKGTVSVEIWGTGTPRREFLWSEDMAEACVFIMQRLDVSDIRDLTKSKGEQTEHLNIGTGQEISIKDLALLAKEIVGFPGPIHFNPDKPDGTPRKLTDVSRLHALGWRHSVELKEGVQRLFDWYREG
jgi:GDP-L-fucose synthase